MRAASSLKNSALVTPRTLFIIIKPYYINREKKERKRGQNSERKTEEKVTDALRDQGKRRGSVGVRTDGLCIFL